MRPRKRNLAGQCESFCAGGQTYSSVWSQHSFEHVASAGGLAYTIFLWKGSIWRSIWGEILIWGFAYSLMSVMYRYWLDQEQRISFLAWCNYTDSYANLISTPLSVALGFFGSTVYTRWWGHWNECIGWTEKLAYNLISLLPGRNDEMHAYRVTIHRWVQAAHALTYVDYASCYEYDAIDLIQKGLLTADELSLIHQTNSSAAYDVTLIWAMDLLNEIELKYANKPELVGPSFCWKLKDVRDEILAQRAKDANYRGYDYIPIPLPYMQTLAFSVYAYFFAALFSRQYVAGEDRQDPTVMSYQMAKVNDYGVPFMTFVELIFYIGWVKTMALLFDPMQSYSYAYHLMEIEEGLSGRGHTIFQAHRESVVAPVDTTLHGYVRRFNLPPMGGKSVVTSV